MISSPGLVEVMVAFVHRVIGTRPVRDARLSCVLN
jgi:hypothetical protein